MKFQKYIKRLPALSFMIMLLCAGIFLSSCEEDEVISDEVVLESFGPAGVQHGEQIKFIGRNLDKVNAIVLPGAEVSSSQFVTHTSQLIELVVPEEALAGRVILKTSSGDIESKSMLSFQVPVEIESITAEARPGSDITIKGKMVNWIEEIVFNDGLVVTEFVSKSLNELVVSVPMEAQTGYLLFSSGGTEPLTFTSQEELIVTLPVVASLSPTAIKHTDDLTISGTDLDLVTKITFPGGTEVTDFESQTATQLVVKVPNTAVDGKLTLQVLSGLTVQSEEGISIILPHVTAFTPAETDSHTPGTELTMVGTNLDLVASISFPGVATAVTSFVSQSAEEIVVVIPEGAAGGTVALKTIHDYTVPVALPFGDQLELTHAIYDDAPQNGFGAWGGWGGASFDVNSTENPRVGTTSIKATYAGDWGGAAQFGGGNLSTEGVGSFAFSIYGGAGTDGQNINIILKSSAGEASMQVPIVEGEWTDYQIPLSELGSPANVTELSFQDTGFAGEVFIDHIGLR